MLITRALPEEVRKEPLIEKCRQDFDTAYRECWDEHTQPYDDIPLLLDELESRKLKLTVLSNKPHEFTLLAVKHLLPNWEFELVLGQREGIPRKPDPAGMIDICEQLEIPAKSFLYLGDTATDMKTATSAGCFPVGVLWGFRPEKELRENGAQAIINAPLELIDLLD